MQDLILEKFDTKIITRNDDTLGLYIVKGTVFGKEETDLFYTDLGTLLTTFNLSANAVEISLRRSKTRVSLYDGRLFYMEARFKKNFACMQFKSVVSLLTEDYIKRYFAVELMERP